MADNDLTNIPNNGYVADIYRAIRPTDDLGADVLVPASPTNIVNEKNEKVESYPAMIPERVINVHDEYPWTLSPLAARAYVPRIELTEYKQVLSSELMGYAYSLAGTVDNLKVAPSVAVRAVVPGVRAVGINLNRVFNTNFFGSVEGAAGNPQVLKQLDKPAEQVSKQDVTKNDPYNGALKAYTGLYAVEPTGFVYYLPYASNENFKQSNSWGEPQGYVAKALGSVAELIIASQSTGAEAAGAGAAGAGAGAAGAAGTGAGAGAGGPTGTQIVGSLTDIVKAAMTAGGGTISSEKPQAYQGPDSSGRDSITVKFILYNTINFTDIKKNWELCYLLSYQNLPNRKGINLMDPPKLYRLLIPGYRQFPMCWVSSIDIKNLGAVRMMNIKDPDAIVVSTSSRGPYIKMIPEAYEVNITFQHAFFSSQNLFSYAESANNTVTTTLNVAR